MKSDSPEYDNKDKCPMCGSINNIINPEFDGSYLSECDTRCKKCGHEDSWAYGFYQSKIGKPPEDYTSWRDAAIRERHKRMLYQNELRKVMELFGDFEPDPNENGATWTKETLHVLRNAKMLLDRG
jgi:hypothetical protein